MDGEWTGGVELGFQPAWLPRKLYPFEHRFLEIDGCRVHYVDEGIGPTLLMLHGNPTWSFLYRDVIRDLKDRFRCIAPDYPGFGLSTARPGFDYRPVSHARIIERFVDELGLSGITLMVQDWGGPIGLWVAERHPERFQALVIGNSWAWPAQGEPHLARFSKLVGGRVAGVLIRRFNAFVNVLVPAGIKRHRVSREVMRAYRRPFRDRSRREATHVLPREILASRDFLAEIEAGLPAIAGLPALIVWGDRDPAFRVADRQRFEHVFRDHETVVLPGAGHYVQEDAPAELASAVSQWWDKAFEAL